MLREPHSDARPPKGKVKRRLAALKEDVMTGCRTLGKGEKNFTAVWSICWLSGDVDGKSNEPGISRGCPVLSPLQVAGHAQERVGRQGGGTIGRGLPEPTLPRGLWLRPVMAGGGWSLMGLVPFFLPPARPVAKCACPADSS